MIGYGNSRSNLCRVIANMSKSKGIPCYVISPADDSVERYETNNPIIVKMMEAQIIHCLKTNVSQTVAKIMEECKTQGLKPYYIYGDIYGKGNEKVAVQAYVETYDEIKQFEKDNKISFDYIFHASGTGTTQSGLVSGSLLHGDDRHIIGISIARKAEHGKGIIAYNVSEYISERDSMNIENAICFEDKYVIGGYGKYNTEIMRIIREILNYDGVPFDTLYTGKAFWGMTQYSKEKLIANKNILFIHTGGSPLFFDKLNIN